jgi:hypothetical protein
MRQALQRYQSPQTQLCEQSMDLLTWQGHPVGESCRDRLDAGPHEWFVKKMAHKELLHRDDGAALGVRSVDRQSTGKPMRTPQVHSSTGVHSRLKSASQAFGRRQSACDEDSNFALGFLPLQFRRGRSHLTLGHEMVELHRQGSVLY